MRKAVADQLRPHSASSLHSPAICHKQGSAQVKTSQDSKAAERKECGQAHREVLAEFLQHLLLLFLRELVGSRL